MEIGKSGFYYQNDEKQKGNSCGWTSWGAIKEICEGKDFIIIGKVYFDRKIFTKDQMGQIRALCQKYAGRKYHFIGVESRGSEKQQNIHADSVLCGAYGSSLCRAKWVACRNR